MLEVLLDVALAMVMVCPACSKDFWGYRGGSPTAVQA